MPLWRHRLRVAEASILMLAARGLVRFVQFDRWRHWLGEVRPNGMEPLARDPAGLPQSVRQCLAAIDRALIRQSAAKCLPQAMALHWMLVRRGLKPSITIGVLKGQCHGSLDQLHAWVVLDGVIILGDSQDAHAALFSFKPLSRADS